MAAKRLVVIVLVALAALTAAPRQASAQWIDVMKWLSSLDPGPFPGFGGGISLGCYDPSAKAGERWSGPTCGGDTLVKLLSKQDVSPEDAARAADHVRLVFGAFGGLAYGDNNLDKADLTKNVNVFHLSGTAAFRVSRSVDVGSGVGYVRFYGSPIAVNTVIVEPFIEARPLVNLPWNRYLRGIGVRLSVPIFPTGFTPQQFGYPADVVSTSMNGKHELMPSVSVIFGMPIPK